MPNRIPGQYSLTAFELVSDPQTGFDGSDSHEPVLTEVKVSDPICMANAPFANVML